MLITYESLGQHAFIYQEHTIHVGNDFTYFSNIHFVQSLEHLFYRQADVHNVLC